MFSCVIPATGEFEVNKLSDRKDLKKEFTTTELADLQLILNYYSQAICGGDTLSRDKAIHCFMDHLDVLKRNQKNTGDITLQLSANQQLTLYNRLQPSTMIAIWNIPSKTKAELSEKFTMKLRTDGIYIKLLHLLKTDYPPFGAIAESTIASGGINPSTFTELLNNHTEFNFFDDRIRLFFTLHYLTINDQNKRLMGGVK